MVGAVTATHLNSSRLLMEGQVVLVGVIPVVVAFHLPRAYLLLVGDGSRIR